MDDYTTILDRMKETYKSYTGFYPSDCSDTGIRFKAYASELFNCMLYADYIKDQIFIQSASGESLDKHARKYNLSRMKGSKSAGVVTFSASQVLAGEVVIPKGYIVYNDDGCSYLTDEQITLAVGETSVDVGVTAEFEGSKYNAGIGGVHLFSESIEGIDTVTNAAPIRGGTDIESDEDLRLRLLELAAFPATGANESYYRQLALGVSGIRSVSIIPNKNGVGTIAVYAAGSGETASQSSVTSLQWLMNAFSEACVDVSCYAATEVPINVRATVVVESGFVPELIKTECESALREFLTTRKVGDNVTATEITSILKRIDGVENINFSANNSFENITQNEIAVLGTLSITVV